MSRSSLSHKPAKLRLDVPVLLPDTPDGHDRCVERLIEALTDRDGVEDAHVVEAKNGEPAKLCVHYDPEALPLPKIRRAAEAAGAQLTDRFGHVLWTVDGIGHQRRARAVSTRLAREEGVIEAHASASGHLRLEFDRAATDEAALLKALESVGASRRDQHATDRARGHGHDHDDGHGHDHSHGPFGERGELIFALLAGVAYLTGVLISVLGDGSEWVPRGLYFAAYFFGGFFTVREAWETIRGGRFEVDFLMLVAAAGAAALGKFAEGAVLLFLFSLGHSLEHYAMGRARRAIEALAELAPKSALVRRDGDERELPIEQVEVDDVVIVKPNARLPADGFVVAGETSVDQAPVTGESVPVDKRPVADRDAARSAPERVAPEHRVFAGTINGSGAIEVAVTRRAEDNTLARVVRLVQEAETQKSPTQRFTDRFERVFVPAVLSLVGLLLFAWAVIDEPFADSFYRAMAVLVAASPCALAISTPSAVLSGVARAARGGVLVKGGAPLENLGRLTAIAFDKTGTLTEGKPRLTDAVPAQGATEDELLATAAAVERLSDHPLAAAVVRGAAERTGGAPTAEAHDLRALTGRGVQATVGAETAYVGNAALFGELGGPAVPAELSKRVTELEEGGRTAMIVRHGERYLGVIALMDTPRAAAADVIARLRDLGIRRTIMISGDNQRVAQAVADQVGVDEAWGELLPEDKVDAIKRLQIEETRTAMVGDGVNDAPAMANSTVGIAMGAAGSDVALETADVALMSDELGQLPFATGLSRRTSSIIKQNLFVSLGIVALLVPATILGLGIGPAVGVHEGSTLVVVFNALRLLAFRESA